MWAIGAAGAGYAEMNEEANTHDPLMRLMLRYDGMEVAGREVRTAGGVAVRMDERERVALTENRGQQSAAADREVAEVAVPLHVMHAFTDCWATDGSVEVVEEQGKMRKRAACGAYEGVQPLARKGTWETPEAWDARRVGACDRARIERVTGRGETCDRTRAGMWQSVEGLKTKYPNRRFGTTYWKPKTPHKR